MKNFMGVFFCLSLWMSWAFCVSWIMDKAAWWAVEFDHRRGRGVLGGAVYFFVFGLPLAISLIVLIPFLVYFYFTFMGLK